ncbi:ATP synthase subunit gamma mitochondrial [Phtheirospermum japonicum]|uniref:F-ATPase gamma subunit n=1 Tax=Phtheirospermum japonicum TaxID=374723 RepID=A0A830BBV9_9LAMI|nr:ATP synthase subunit gamma mitochondrial [Phtheirospermum japonicum]
MAMAALRREGRRIAAPLICPHPIRPTLAPSKEQALLGVRSISTQVVRNRMKSVRNIQKITKAMKMVAASKLRAIQSKAENSRGLWQPFTALLGDTPSVDVKKNVIVTISSDKGLCGGINSTSVKTSRGLHKLNSGPEKECKYVILGEKAKAQLVRDSKKDIELTLTELQKNPLNYTQVAVLADDILKNVEYDALRIVYNKFQSVVSFVPTTSTVLSPEVVEREAEAGGKLGELDSYEIEGGETKSEVLFNAVLENACSEQGARMSAMDSSSRNAGDMLDRLTLTYNSLVMLTDIRCICPLLMHMLMSPVVKLPVQGSATVRLVRSVAPTWEDQIDLAIKFGGSHIEAICVQAVRTAGSVSAETSNRNQTVKPDGLCRRSVEKKSID